MYTMFHSSANRSQQLWFHLVVSLTGMLFVGKVMAAGSLDPTNAPGPTMHTLDEIYQRVESFTMPQTLAATTTVLQAGYYVATNLTLVDADLAAANIRAGATVFGVTGKTEVVDTTSGDATAGDILAGKKAWVDGAELTGNIQTRTLSAANDTVAAGNYAATTLSAVDADLTTANIRAGATVFGVAGKTEVVDTTSGDATVGDILSGTKAWVDGAELTGNIQTRTLSAATDTVAGGYYIATNLTLVDTDLTAANIKTNVTIFGVAGTMSTNVASAYPVPVAKTGRTTSYASEDDGALQKGVAWPNPRFTVGTGVDGTNCVTDNLTGLMWARNADIFGAANWEPSMTNCNNLTYGGYADWRMPNIKELQSLIDYGRASPALPVGHPFIGVGSSYYWSSTMSSDTNYAWYVTLPSGAFTTSVRAYPMCAWPVRSGYPSLSDGLVAWYPLDGDANDASGYGNNLTVTGASPTTNRFGQASHAYAFRGTDRLQTAGRVPLLENTNHTISAWVCSTNAAEAGIAGYFSDESGKQGNSGYYLSIRITSVKFALCEGRQTAGGAWDYALANTAQSGDGVWHHLVGVRGNGVASLYVDGVLQTTTTTIEPAFDSYCKLYIGWLGVFKGAVDNVRIYNRALSSGEVVSLYNLVE